MAVLVNMILAQQNKLHQDSLIFISQHKMLLDKFLLKILPDNSNKLYQAINYSVLSNGKRLRAMLVYATGAALGTNLNFLHPAAASVELIHSYSLIHDDLPAIDNDDLRRGKPSCHKKFDEATAILAGDALQALAFSILVSNTVVTIPDRIQINMLKSLTDAIGIRGMVYGQALDLAAETIPANLEQLNKIHHFKTGVLIKTCILLGMHASQITPQHSYWQQLSQFGEKIGLAFQIIDDILEATQDTQKLGKSCLSDLNNNKTTFVTLLGVKTAQTTANQLIQAAFASISQLGDEFNHLRYLANYFIQREF